MSFFRPEVVAVVQRWRGVLVGVGLTVAGLYALLVMAGAVQLAGLALVAVGLAVLVQGIIRVRFRPAPGGVGVVEVTEGQLAYFHPRRGAAISLDAVTRIELHVRLQGDPAQPAPFWAFHHSFGPPLVIPAGAAGAERLTDVLAVFPGADLGRVIAAGRATEEGGFLIWEQEDTERPALESSGEA